MADGSNIMRTADSNKRSALPAILALSTSTPATRYSQEEIYASLCDHAEFYRQPVVHRIFMNSDIRHRHLYIDLHSFDGMETVDELHERYRRGALEIGKQAIEACLAKGGLNVADIDCIIVASCTGYLCPALSSIYIKELGLRTDVQRADLVGMGCAGAMPALQRAHDFVMAYPSKKALVVAVEICSACYFIDDSLETVVGNSICADGAAALVMGMSHEDVFPKIMGFNTFLEPSCIDRVGFEQREGKLRIILSKDIRDMAGGMARVLIDQILHRFGITQDQIAHWILHSGGRKVIDGIREELGLSTKQVSRSNYVLENFGNMSSPTVLFVLQATQQSLNGVSPPRKGDLGIMMALGPGLSIEGALLKW